MPQHITGLRARLESNLATGQNLSLILLNALEGISQTADLATILALESIQITNGYQPVAYTYTANSATFDTGAGWLSAPAVNAVFAAETGGAGIPHTHIAQIQGRTGRANWPIASLDTSADQLTVTAHGLSNGARAFVRSTGTLPAGAVVSGNGYYVKSISANVIELYTDAGLTSKVNFTSAGVGTLYLQNCGGSLCEYLPAAGTINAGQSKTFQFTYRIR